MKLIRHRGGGRGFSTLTAAAAWFAGTVTAALVAFLLHTAWPLLVSGRIMATLTGPWRPFADPAAFGIGSMAVVSLVMATLAVALAFPAAVGVNVFVHGVGPRRLRRPVLALVQFMTSVPTVVYGFVAVVVLVPLIRRVAATGSGFCLAGAVLVLALLVLPTMVLVIHARLVQTDGGVGLACLALGLSPAQTLALVVLPAARGSLAAALVLGFNRALGDTLIALMVAGNAPQWPGSPWDSVRSLTAHIALVLATDTFSPQYRSVAAAGLLLFLMAGASSLLVRRAVGRGAPT